MCGITGLIHLDGAPVSPVILQKMTDAIAHRGPDGEGHWIEGNVGISTRLGTHAVHMLGYSTAGSA